MADSTNYVPGGSMPQPEPDLAKFFSSLNLPMIPGMEIFVEAQRRNLEVIAAANRVALDGARAVARRHMEIMQQTMSEMTSTMQALSTAQSPNEKASKQAELLKSGYERAISNMKEISDLIQKSNAEAVSLLNRRFAESLDEVKTLIAKSSTHTRP